MKILGIETSCDETAVSVVEGKRDKLKVLSNLISSQIAIHKQYKGVVPEVAAREHVLNIVPVLKKSLRQAKSSLKKIDAIAVASGPGLVTSLMSGVETAKTLSYALSKPLVSVNHIEAHIYSCFLDLKTPIKFPALFLTVSGGHTMIILMKGHGKFKVIGDTRDDAAGEAFDKGAKLLGLDYPGGPLVSANAQKFKGESDLVFPRPMLYDKNYDFSFSGLKTSLLYKIQADKNWQKRMPEYCYKYQEAIVDVLVKKTIRAALDLKVKTVCLAGGVSANSELRSLMEQEVKKHNLVFIKPDLKYTTDNAAMVAAAGYFAAQTGNYTAWQKLKVNPNLNF